MRPARPESERIIEVIWMNMLTIKQSGDNYHKKKDCLILLRQLLRVIFPGACSGKESRACSGVYTINLKIILFKNN